MLAISGHGYSSNSTAFVGGGRTNTNVHDAFRANVKRMRQIQRRSKEKEAEQKQPVKALWKSEKYSNVQSKIKTDIIDKEPGTPRPQSARYLRAHSRSGPSIKNWSRPSTPDPSPEKMTVPQANCAKDVKFIRNNFDFIKINGINARHSGIVRSPSLTALDDLKKKHEDELNNYQKGKVPTYLKTRKNQWKKEEEDRIANTPDPDMPEGHKALPEAERRNTLKLLDSNEQELLKQLSCLPLRNDTLWIRTQKKEIDKKLAEIEEARKIFSRPKVFVKVD